jgi:hypothetical protein
MDFMDRTKYYDYNSPGEEIETSCYCFTIFLLTISPVRAYVDLLCRLRDNEVVRSGGFRPWTLFPFLSPLSPPTMLLLTL